MHHVVLGRHFNQKRKMFSSFFLLSLNELNEQTDNRRTTQFHTVLLCLYLADPATFLASNYVPGALFSSESSLFYSVMEKIFE